MNIWEITTVFLLGILVSILSHIAGQRKGRLDQMKKQIEDWTKILKNHEVQSVRGRRKDDSNR